MARGAASIIAPSGSAGGCSLLGASYTGNVSTVDLLRVRGRFQLGFWHPGHRLGLGFLGVHLLPHRRQVSSSTSYYYHQHSTWSRGKSGHGLYWLVTTAIFCGHKAHGWL